MKLDVITLDAKKVGAIDLDDAVFGVEVRRDVLTRTVNWQLDKRRAGTHAVKHRGEVSGTTRKPFAQKGTGRARQGTTRAPQHRGGAVVFGPVVRSHATKLPKKFRALALRCALSSKAADGKLVVIDDLKMDKPKTKELAKCVAKLGWRSALVIDGPMVDEKFKRAAANIAGLDVLPSQGANVYDILRRDTLVLTKTAVDKLVERLR